MSTNSTDLRRARGATGFLFFAAGVTLATWAPYIPVVKARLDIGASVLGLALLALAVGGMLAMSMTGWLVQRHGSGTVARGFALAVAVLLPLPILAPSLSWLVAGLLVFGASHGAMDVAMNAQGVTVQRAYRRPVMSSLHALFSIGGLAGAGFAALMLWLDVAIAMHVALVSLAMIAGLLLTRGWMLDDRGHAQAEGLQLARPTGLLLLLGCIAVLSMVGEGAVLDWSAVYMHESIGASPAIAAGGFAAFSLTMAAGRLGGDALVARFGEVNVLRIGTLIAALGLGAALLVGHPLAALIGFACVGLGLANVVPVVFATAGRVPGVAPAHALAAVSTVGYFGFLVGPPAIGFTAEATSLPVALGSIVLFALIIAALAHHVGRVNAHAHEVGDLEAEAR
jgi:hypothetical protein